MNSSYVILNTSAIAATYDDLVKTNYLTCWLKDDDNCKKHTLKNLNSPLKNSQFLLNRFEIPFTC